AAVSQHYPKEAAAAQMAAGVATGTAPATVATPTKAAPASKEDAAEAAPTVDKATLKKRQQMGAGLGFMWGFIGLMLARYVILSPRTVKAWGLSSMLMTLGVALGLGLVLAGIGFVIGGLFKKA